MGSSPIPGTNQRNPVVGMPLHRILTIVASLLGAGGLLSANIWIFNEEFEPLRNTLNTVGLTLITGALVLFFVAHRLRQKAELEAFMAQADEDDE